MCLCAGCFNKYIVTMVSGRKISNKYYDILCKQVLSQINILNTNYYETIVFLDLDRP